VVSSVVSIFGIVMILYLRLPFLRAAKQNGLDQFQLFAKIRRLNANQRAPIRRAYRTRRGLGFAPN